MSVKDYIALSAQGTQNLTTSPPLPHGLHTGDNTFLKCRQDRGRLRQQDCVPPLFPVAKASLPLMLLSEKLGSCPKPLPPLVLREQSFPHPSAPLPKSSWKLSHLPLLIGIISILPLNTFTFSVPGCPFQSQPVLQSANNTPPPPSPQWPVLLWAKI